VASAAQALRARPAAAAVLTSVQARKAATWCYDPGSCRGHVAQRDLVLHRYSHVIDVEMYQADLCSAQVGMCASSECAFSVGSIEVQACNASGCSASVLFSSGIPLACGGGCCC
jgi:hypothetical protein